MDWPKFARRLLLADNRISQAETAIIRRAVMDSGAIDREEVEFLLQLKREAISVHPDFDLLLFQALRSVVLANGIVSDEEALWLRGVILSHGRATDSERQFVTQLRSEADQTGPEFARLYADVMRV